MGLIGTAFGASMVVGPVAGGALAALHPQAPFYAIVILAGANFLLAWRALPESRPDGLARPPWRDLARSFVPTPIRLLARVHDRRIALFLVLFFVFFAAFAVVEAMGTLYLGKRFGANELDAALVFAWIGLFLAATQAGPLGRLVDSYRRGVAAGGRLRADGRRHGGRGLGAVLRLVLRGRARSSRSATASASRPSPASSPRCAAPRKRASCSGRATRWRSAGRIVGAIGGGALMSERFLAAPFLASSALLTLGPRALPRAASACCCAASSGRASLRKREVSAESVSSAAFSGWIALARSNSAPSCLDVVGIRHAAVDRADRGALLGLVEAHTLGAELRVDHEGLLALADRLVRALRLADAAVDALLGDHRGHASFSRAPLPAGRSGGAT